MEKNIAELALKAQNVEELIVLAKEAGVELALEVAKKFFAQTCVEDQELENVSGGVNSEDQVFNIVTDLKVYL